MMSIFEWVPILLLIFAVWRIKEERNNNLLICKIMMEKNRRIELKQLKKVFENQFNNRLKKYLGVKEQHWRKVAIAEKMAERAFNMASSANLGVVALQKALQVPRVMNKAQLDQNGLAKRQVDELFSGETGFDWLRPILSNDENEILDKIEEEKRRKMNGEHKI